VIRFIIVDDEEKWQKKIKDIILSCSFATDNSIVIKTFNGYNSKLEQEISDKSQRTIYLLDIDLKGNTTGISIALKIRENDWDSEIIFLTNHDQYFEKVYRSIYKVFDFIEKFDHVKVRLKKDIKNILSQKYDIKMFRYSNRQIDMQIYLKDILYIYRDTSERKLHIVTTNNEFLLNLTIKKALIQLDERFILVHRSCIVNNDHVNVFNWNKGSFILDNHKEIYLLSKKYKDKIKKIKDIFS